MPVSKESSQPVAHKFARAKYSKEVFSDKAKANFDNLPSWQRHLIDRIIEHGDLKRAAAESKVSRHVKDAVDFQLTEQKSVSEALEANGITDNLLCEKLLDCLTASQIKIDKHGNPIKATNHQVVIKTLELIFKLRGDFQAKVQGDGSKGAIDLFEDTKVD